MRRPFGTPCRGLLAFAFLLAACSGGDASGDRPEEVDGQPRRGGTLNMLGSSDVDYMDPNLTYLSAGYLAMRPWTRQPYTYPADTGENTTAIPDLATALPTISGGGRVVSYTIREGARWDTSPPRQITAEDQIRGVKRTCNPAQPFGGLINYLDVIVGLRAFCDGFADVPPDRASIASYMDTHEIAGITVGPDERTVVFALTTPTPHFTDLLTMPAFTPAPAEYDAHVPGSADLAQHTVSSGPYRIEVYEPRRRIVLERNPAWTAEADPVRAAWVDRIVIDQTVSQESTQQQLETRTPSADMAFNNFPPPSQLPRLIEAEDPNLILGRTAETNPHVRFNLRSPNNGHAMRDLRFRRALMHGLNRDHLVQVLGGPRVSPPLSRVLPPTILGGDIGFDDPYPHDAEMARELLRSASAEQVVLTVLYTADAEGARRVFATIQRDLSELGIEIRGSTASANEFVEAILAPAVAERGEWDLALDGWAADWYGNAALSFFRPLFGGEEAFPPAGNNIGFYDSPETNRLIRRAEQVLEPDEAAAAWRDVDVQVMEDAPFYPITSPRQPVYHADQVHGCRYVPSLRNCDPANVWLSADRDGG